MKETMRWRFTGTLRHTNKLGLSAQLSSYIDVYLPNVLVRHLFYKGEIKRMESQAWFWGFRSNFRQFLARSWLFLGQEALETPPRLMVTRNGQ